MRSSTSETGQAIHDFMYEICVDFVLRLNIVIANAQELSLMRFMFDESKYDKRILPSVGVEYGPLNVTVGLTIYRIEDLVNIQHFYQ